MLLLYNDFEEKRRIFIFISRHKVFMVKLSWLNEPIKLAPIIHQKRHITN